MSLVSSLSRRLLFVLALAAAGAACSSGGSGATGGDDGGTPSSTPTPSSTSTSDPTKPPKDTPDASAHEKPDAGPTIDKTEHFELTLEGETIPMKNITVSLTPKNNLHPVDRVRVQAQYQQQFPMGFESTATFSVAADVTATATGACGDDGRDASYLFKDTDGAIRGISTANGGNCSMNIISKADDGFFSGTATGVVGSAPGKAFKVAWGHAAPKP